MNANTETGTESGNKPNPGAKIGIVLALAAAIVLVLVVKQSRKQERPQSQEAQAPAAATTAGDNIKLAATTAKAETTGQTAQARLPRLLDLGADKCMACKMLAPILDELKQEYTGRMKVEFIDVWKNPGVSRQYKIRLIPTQIFFDSSGRELFRHEGFISKEDILAKWKELGVDLHTGK